MKNKIKVKPEVYLSKLTNKELNEIIDELDKPNKITRMAIETIYERCDMLYLQAQSLYYPLIMELQKRLRGGIE